jgi:hypothetical protein
VPPPGSRSGAATPTEEKAFFEDYREEPKEYRGGILGSLLKLYGQPSHGSHSPRNKRYSGADFSNATTPNHSPPDSGATTPNGGWFGGRKNKNQSTGSLAQLIGSSTTLGSPVVSGLGEQVAQRLKEQQEEEKRKRPKHKRTHSSAMAAFNRLNRPKLEDEIKITIHIAETISRQRYLMKLCKALMLYGAPTHRLEEYMNMRVSFSQNQLGK